ncbi:src kinase-associated phosphoprotein 1 isoform X3 [Narcine bancroftii]|uniref:src kinase-associated phosphoprotein 1 isoform X3 n=1 Tax=Narcine bancroftii TaxID=1343680 RepID=UPI0038318C72
MAIPEDIRRLLEDAEYFVGEVLHNEKLSKKAKDKREALLDGFRQMKYRYQQEFQLKGDSGDWVSRHEDSSDDNQSLTYVPSGLSDSVSVASENQEDVQFEDIPLVAAQDLSSILKQGYLEKKRRDHSFFGSEWRRRFCVLNKNIFHFYNSEKDKQQKDAFYVSDAQLVQNLRKDSKKNSCFEVLSSDKKVYQFTAPSVREAKDWVDHISFVLKEDDFPPPIPLDEEMDHSGDTSINFEDYYLGLWDCTGQEEDELSFKRGDMVHILSKDYNSYGWWVGEMEGIIGIVPKEFLMPAYDI